MSLELTTCPLCGSRFDASKHITCQFCPLQKGCQLVCCPSCGFELVDIQKSTLAQWASRWLFQNRSKLKKPDDLENEVNKI